MILQCSEQFQSLISVNQILKYIIRDKGRHYAEIKVVSKLNPACPTNIAGMSYCITSQDITVGYTVHNLLHIVLQQQDTMNESISRPRVTPYDGRLEFEFGYETFKALKK